jgi:SH3-like domain-containing protein
LLLLPTEELAFRSRPDIAPDSLIRRIPVTEQLICLDPASVAVSKIGVTGQWLKVRDAQNKEGFVAAWYVKYASGSQQAASAPAAPTGGALTVKATAEGIALRKQPVVSDATLIKRLPLGTVFTVTEANAEAKVGRNDQWLKVKDPAGVEGFVAAWFVRR